MRTALRAGALVLLLGVGAAVSLFIATNRAIARLDETSESYKFSYLGLKLLQARDDSPTVVEGFARWLERHADDPSRDRIVFEAAAKSFKKRKPEQTDAFVRAAALTFPGDQEAAGWVTNWDDPKVTAMLEDQLVRFGERKRVLLTYGTMQLIKELERRKVPHSPAYLDGLLRAYATNHDKKFVALFRAESDEALSALLTRAKDSPKAEVREAAVLLSSELGRSKPDAATVLATFETCAVQQRRQYGLFSPMYGLHFRAQDLLEGPKKSPKAIWETISEPVRGCGPQLRALLALGKTAVPSVTPLYSSNMLMEWSLAVSVLAQHDPEWMAQQVEKSILELLAAEAKKSASKELAERVAKGLVALSSAPANPRVERCYLLAFAAQDWRAHYLALAGLQERLPPEPLVAAVLLFVSDKDSFNRAEIDHYKEVMTKLGPPASPALVKSLQGLLAAARGNPAEVRWVQKVIAIDALKEIGEEGALDILNRYAADPSSYQSITGLWSEKKGTERSTKRTVPFRDLCDSAIEAIKKRTGK